MSNKLETFDFCLDLLDLYNKDQNRYIIIFLQLTNKINKVKILHSPFTENEVNTIVVPAIGTTLEYIKMSKLTKVKHSGSLKGPLSEEELMEKMQELDIQYIIIKLIKNKELEIHNYLYSSEAFTLANILLSNVPEHINGNTNLNEE